MWARGVRQVGPSFERRERMETLEKKLGYAFENRQLLEVFQGSVMRCSQGSSV